MSKVSRGKLLAALLCWAVLLGCRSEAAGERVISPESFIQAQVDLRQIDRRVPEADSLRAEVLTTHRITEDDLRAFVNEWSDRPAELATVYEEVRHRLREIREERVQQEQSGEGAANGEAEAERQLEVDGETLRLPMPSPGGPPPAQRI
jgi:hypothetical protein